MKNSAVPGLVLCLIAGAQDGKQDLSFQKVIANSASQKSYAFKVSRSAARETKGGKQKDDDKEAGAFEGEYVGGTLHVKSKDVEVARKNEGGYGFKGGEWKSLAELAKDDPLLVDLIKFPAPHTLLQRLAGWLSKLEADEKTSPTKYSGALTETAIKALLGEQWFADEEQSKLQDVSGACTIHFDADGLVSKLEFELTGKLPPEGARSKGIKKPGGIQLPPKKAGGQKPPDQKTGTLRVVITFDEYGKAELKVPEEIHKKIGK